MSQPFVLLFHNADYAGYLDTKFNQGPGKFTRVDTDVIKIETDVQLDKRPSCTWFFKGLSLPVINHLLRVISNCSNNPYTTDLTFEEIRAHTVPYDDMLFNTEDGEELHVVYSIKDIQSSKFRQAVIGPQNVSLYEKDMPHFGPIYVYKSIREEIMLADTSIEIIHTMIPIDSQINNIQRALESLCFGG